MSNFNCAHSDALLQRSFKVAILDMEPLALSSIDCCNLQFAMREDKLQSLVVNCLVPNGEMSFAYAAVAAKNVILAGVKAVVLHDTENVQLRDLGAHFYLSPEDVGSNRASACEAKLQELNSAVSVSASADEITETFLSQFNVSSAPVQKLKCYVMHVTCM
jgi:hypothetical protein